MWCFLPVKNLEIQIVYLSRTSILASNAENFTTLMKSKYARDTQFQLLEIVKNTATTIYVFSVNKDSC